MADNNLKFWENRFTEYLQQHLNHKDSAHDLGHFRRVWKNAYHINAHEHAGADELILLTAALLFTILLPFQKSSGKKYIIPAKCGEDGDIARIGV